MIKYSVDNICQAMEIIELVADVLNTEGKVEKEKALKTLKREMVLNSAAYELKMIDEIIVEQEDGSSEVL